MKIAVPTREKQVDDHFGHCAYYTVFTVDDQKRIVAEEVLPSPEGCGCKSNIAAELETMGVNVMLAGSMGDGALNVLKAHHITVLRGSRGDVRRVTEAYLKGFVLDSGMGCRHNETGEHHCHH